MNEAQPFDGVARNNLTDSEKSQRWRVENVDAYNLLTYWNGQRFWFRRDADRDAFNKVMREYDQAFGTDYCGKGEPVGQDGVE